MIQNVILKLSLPGWVFFLLALILTALALFYYRRTLPPLSPLRRWILTGLRALALLAVLFLLLKPALNLFYRQQEPARVAVLLDDSRSMRIRDAYGLRGDSLQPVVALLGRLPNRDSLHYDLFSFGASLQPFHPNRDTLHFNQPGTDLARALQSVLDSLGNRNLQAIFLFSDGQFNRGIIPLEVARRSSVPIYTVLLGDTALKKDLRISGLRVSRIVYAGKEVPLEVRIFQQGFPAGKVTIRLRQGKQVLAAQTVELAKSGFERRVSLTFLPARPGEWSYTVELDSLPGELTARNNRSSFLLKVLKNKIRVLLLSGQPSFDQRAFTYALQEIPEIQLRVRTQRPGGRYLEGELSRARPDSQDVFLLLGFPTRQTRAGDLDLLAAAVRKNHTALFMVLAKWSDLKALSRAFGKYLPLEAKSFLLPGKKLPVQLNPRVEYHPVVRLDEDAQQNKRLWQDLPPIAALNQGLEWRKEGTVLLTTPGDFPLLVANFSREVKSLVLAGANVYQWHYLLQDDPQREQFFRQFLEHSLKWLVNREDLQRIQIQPVKKIFQAGEAVRFTGQVYDRLYRQVTDAEVEIQIAGKDYQEKDVLLPLNGFYRYAVNGLPPGTYTYRLTARRGEETLGTRRGKFVVEPLELEMQNLRPDYPLMQEIARQSGGELWNVRQFIEHFPALQYHPTEKLVKHEKVLWTSLTWLALLILVLSVEWFLRKRWGLL